MNYYEELDVPRNASVEEIRRAYRGLARLLHPDQHRDPRLCRLAELQMTRLNGLLEVLTDPQLRREYDRSLEEVRPCRGNGRPGRWLWGAVLASAGLALVFLSRPPLNRPAVRAAVSAFPAPPHAGPAAQEPPQHRLRARPAGRRTRRAAPRAPARQTVAQPPANARPAVPVNSEAPRAATAPADATPQRAAPFDGVWVYAPAGPPAPSDRLYRPEYIEMRVVERQGVLKGSYTGRYQVTDQSIAPVVAFAFEGRAHGDRADLRWFGAGGAQGSIALQLIGDTAVRVTWTADQLGPEAGLAGGVATLMRWRDP